MGDRSGHDGPSVQSAPVGASAPSQPGPDAGPRSAASPPVGPTTRAERSLAPDLARGAVLLFIALANVAVYNYDRDLNVGLRPVAGSALDQTLDTLVSLVVDARSYPMFAMLLGYGLVKVASRQLAAGRSWRAAQVLTVRRSLWLLAFGAVHAGLLFYGDILGAYAVTSLIVLLVLALSTRLLAVFAAVTLVPLAVLAGFGGLFTESTGLLSGDVYGWSVLERLGLWMVALVTVGFLLALVCPVLVGVVLARSGVVDRPWEHRRTLTWIMLGGFAVNLVGGLPHALHVGGWVEVGPPASAGFATLHAATGVACGLAYVCLFALVAAALRERQVPRVLGAVRATGERSLTSYLLQSVVLAPLLSPWGLGWGSSISTTEAYGLAAATWLTTVVVAAALSAAGRRGPAEVLLRRLTYGRRPGATVRSPAPAPGAGAGRTDSS